MVKKTQKPTESKSVQRKKTAQKKADGVISFILDETGSMMDMYKEAVSMFNEFIKSLQTSGIKANMTLTRFNSTKIDIDYSNIPIADVKQLTDYKPDALTPLYDAVGKTIDSLKGTVKDKQRVMMIILTDGLENASHIYNQKQVFDMITELRAKGWEFTFLGANQDAWVTSEKLGIPMSAAVSYHQDATGYAAVGRTMASNTISYMAGGTVSSNLTQDYIDNYTKMKKGKGQ